MFDSNKLDVQVGLSANANLSDDDLAAVLSTPTISTRAVPIAELQTYCLQLPLWGAIKLALKDPNTPDPVAAVCETASDLLLNYKADTVDFSLPAFRGALAALVEARIASADEQVGILGLATVYTYICGGLVFAGDVVAARAARSVRVGGQQLRNWLDKATGLASNLISDGERKGELPSQADLAALFVGA